MSFALPLHDNATFINAFERNEREARENIETAHNQFWKEYWARQAYFWARQARWIKGASL